MQRRVGDPECIRKKYSMIPTGALAGEPQEDGGLRDVFQEMFLLVTTQQRVRRAGSAFPGISTQQSISFQARIFFF